MKFIPDKVKKSAAEKIFKKNSPQFRLYSFLSTAFSLLAWIALLSALVEQMNSYFQDGGVEYALLTGALILRGILIFIVFRFASRALIKLRQTEYYQYPFDKKDESVEADVSNHLNFSYRIGKRRYREEIAVFSAEYREDWNAVAVRGNIKRFRQRGQDYILEKESNGARVFFDYFNPGLIDFMKKGSVNNGT